LEIRAISSQAQRKHPNIWKKLKKPKNISLSSFLGGLVKRF